MVPGIREEDGVREQIHKKVFDHALFCPKKTPYFCTGIGHLYTKSCKNEMAKMKERRQNDRELKSTGR